LNLAMCEQLDLIGRTAELARTFGIDFFSVLTRGSQYRVESLLVRLAHTNNFIMPSPSREQVGSQPAMEAIPLVMEPESRLYGSPVVVLDFQSLYPSQIIAYNMCYSTCVGRTAHARAGGQPVRLGVTQYSYPVGAVLPTATSGGGAAAAAAAAVAAAAGATITCSPPHSSSPPSSSPTSDNAAAQEAATAAGAAATKPGRAAHAGSSSSSSTCAATPDNLIICPNGVAYVPPEVRPGVLPRMLSEILNTRIMIKGAMKRAPQQDKVLHRVLNARQLGLKLIANVTYGYTAAGFSGR
ncbi:hypothetical protein Agub_g8267, partial [Astrephomene gubernaculifera]